MVLLKDFEAGLKKVCRCINGWLSDHGFGVGEHNESAVRSQCIVTMNKSGL